MQKEHWYLLSSGILSGLIIFGAQILVNLGLSLYQIIILPALITLLLLPFVLFKYAIKKPMLKIFALYGVIGMFAAFADFLPIVLGVPVAIVVLLIYTMPFWTIILGRLILKEKITKRKIIAMIIVLIGAIVLVNPFSVKSIGNPLGIVIAAIGGIILAIWFIMGRIASKNNIHPITTQFGYTLFMLIFLLLTYPLVRLFMNESNIIDLTLNLPLIAWIAIVLYGIFALIIPHILFYFGVRKVESSNASIILLLEPVSAAILASVFLGQAFTWNIVVGGMLILVANVIVVK